MNFKRRHNTTIAAHRANHYLRRFGLKPTPPGQSAPLDRVKEATFGRVYESANSTAKALKSRLGK
jgi:hypothetical protein